MRLPNSDRLGGEGYLPDFWDTVNRIAVTLNLSIEDLAEMMEITPYRLKLLQRYGKEPNVSSAMALSKRVNISFDSLVLNQFDYKLMAQQYFGNQSELPERYLEHSLSRRRTIIPHLNYIEQYFGWAQRALILRRFQLTEGMFADPDATMNMRFAIDLTRYLLDYHRNPAILEHMGWYSARHNRSVALGSELEGANTTGEVYERAFANITPRHIERNYDWRMTAMHDDTCIIEGRPSQEMLSIPDARSLQQPGLCLIRSGFLSYMPNYANLGSVRVRKLSCVSQGDSACQFEVQLLQSRHSA